MGFLLVNLLDSW